MEAVKYARMLRILLMLQLRNRVTAEQLAELLEVSVRTVYRDVEALMVAGVPVYSEVGPEGGYRIDQAWRTQLTGLTTEEAEALAFFGMPGPAAELGLGAVLALTELKLANALPPELRERAALVRERFHLDAPGWFSGEDPVPHLGELAEAAWNDRQISIRYVRWAGEVERLLDPLGIVLKGGLWYLVARHDGLVRTYRVSRVLELTVTDEHFERPEGFDLARFWDDGAQLYESDLYPSTARVRLSPRGLARLPVIMGAAVDRAARATASAPDADEWVELDLPVESTVANAVSELLRFGSDAIVLGPPDLREAVRGTVGLLADLYDA